MKTITFTNYNGVEETVVAKRIVSVTKPSGRIHDNGGVQIDSGRFIAFSGYEDAARVIRELAAIEE